MRYVSTSDPSEQPPTWILVLFLSLASNLPTASAEIASRNKLVANALNSCSISACVVTTEQHNAQNALIEREERFQAMANATPSFGSVLAQ